MKRQTFFLTSVPLALAALGSQIVGWYCLAATAASATLYLMLSPAFSPVQSSSNLPQPSDGDIYRVLIWSGLVLAILSLICVAVSFRRRERGWRFISVTLLALYLVTWVVAWWKTGL